MIEVLFEGVHTNHELEEGRYSIDPLASSSILIRHHGVNVLFDTSAFIYQEKLLQALEARGLKPSDIHHVVNSHYHFDHCSNNFLFSKTAFIHTGDGVMHPNGSAHIDRTRRVWPLVKNIQLIKTPGHSGTEDLSLMVEHEGEIWMCVGDAFREDIVRKECRMSASNPTIFLDSLKFIFSKADVIIPGHGRMVNGKLKEELKKLVDTFTLES
ncbi:MAG: metallo-beta-lactamase protein [uncultured bacterium]|nr:MAG: metallo-beta-lactamase protein [uncultured bacterium]KKT74514.1 MAG: Metallo-beta-lactamase domain-containing protein 1 [Candidatus Peregrinibacteria bacterium GW2011_GWA2_44_7]